MQYIEILVASFVASFGFGILFNIKGKRLVLAAIVGSIGGIVYYTMLWNGTGEIMSIFVASIAFSFFSEILARVNKTPVTTFLICGLIPLVPGGGMYRTMLQAIQGNVDGALATGINTLSIAGVLALGTLLVSTIMKAIYAQRNSKVVKL